MQCSSHRSMVRCSSFIAASAIDLADSQTMLARGVSRWFVVPLEQSVTLKATLTVLRFNSSKVAN
jgi:hypothetical protein